MTKLTEVSVAGITVPAGKAEIIVFDAALPGFGVRKLVSGRATYMVKYEIAGRQLAAVGSSADADPQVPTTWFHCSIWRPFLRPDLACSLGQRAQAPSRSAVAPTVTHVHRPQAAP